MDGFAGTKGAAVAEAVLTPAIVTMLSDGDISAREVAQIGNLCGFSPIFEGYGNADIEALIADIRAQLARDGADLVTDRASQTLTPRLRETALCFALRMALADNRMEDAEMDALARIGGLLGIDKEAFLQIYAVLSMLHRTVDD